ncbi:sensor histidine kinase [Paenibacillus thermoaerophilus]|uniref:histidine kinase n=1 Tax=Paenibacillus thermoaerophilus TaxID=1215385 RepID=A0ABW2UYQ5_9BACL|nr:sensor histidine kinase [Paenibacillus thermoaerophilus]TMV16065.1 sensor histidine kinase [Paenibacillus thermoaerophilus]
MRRWFAKSLKRQLSVLLLIAVLLPLVGSGVISYRIAASVTEEKAKEAGTNTLRQIAGSYEFIVRDVENMSLFLIGHKDFQSYLDAESADITRYSLNVGFLTNLAFSKTYIADITVKPAKPLPELSNTTILRTELPDVLRKYQAEYSSVNKWWSPPYETYTVEGLKRVVSLVREIRNTNNFQVLGTLSISLDEAELSRYLTESGWVPEGDLVLVDGRGTVIASDDDRNLNLTLDQVFPDLPKTNDGSDVFTYGTGQDARTVLTHKLNVADWTLVGVIPTEIYTSQNAYVLRTTALAAGLGIVFAVVLVLMFVQLVTRPLSRLSATMKDLNPDEPIPVFKVRHADEVGLLLHSFNKLSDRIQRLKEQVQQNEAMKKEADILALQAQINPHFLYNTLSSIHWMALMNKDDKIARMVGSLSDFLRFSLNKGEEFCPIEQELAHAQNYADIQSIRFPDQFEIEFLADPTLLRRRMLKLLLQPLIENSLIHGVQKKKEKGMIYVHVERIGNQARFSVEDTGVGIPEAKLNELREQLATDRPGNQTAARSGYGLLNVHRRLVLHYGPDAALIIHSVAGKGTRISFHIPLEEDSE